MSRQQKTIKVSVRDRVLGRLVARPLDEREQVVIAGAGAPIGCPTGITYVYPLDVEPEGDG
ncbi:MAG: hypothetical protein KatS3mg119_1969 [Rhodothalassiaceae bacterium]|nr:MAG: hypothetical protein KatS3mg119_1969 [Rhodothalassiaceae bacterium]